MGEKMYLVSFAAQEAAIKEYCFEACGKILVGGVRIAGAGVFAPCKSAECDHVSESLEMGELDLSVEGMTEIVIRKLNEVEVSDGNKEKRI